MPSISPSHWSCPGDSISADLTIDADPNDLGDQVPDADLETLLGRALELASGKAARKGFATRRRR